MTTLRRLVWIACTVGVTWALAGAIAAAAQTPPSAPDGTDRRPDEVAFRIDAQPIEGALREFASQANLQLVYETAEVSPNIRSSHVYGALTPEAALSRLLAHTNLAYKFINDRTVSIRSADGAPGSSAHLEMESVPRDVQSRLSRSESGALADGSDEQSGAADVTTAHDVRYRAHRNDLEEVVVTAQKREERLIDVPVSVAVLNPDTLSAQGALQLRDFADKIPGVSVSTLGAGYSQVVVRGLTLGQNTDPLPSTVIYVDDVPFGSSVSAGSLSNYTSIDAGLFDMARVEILKGPQGTLYGADAIGGVVKYVTQLPTTEQFDGRVQAGSASTRYGGVSYNAAAFANVPVISDQLALRASSWYSHDGGYIRNLALDQDDVNRSDIYGGRVDLLYKPTDKFSVRLGAFVQNTSRDGTSFADYDLSGRPVEGPLDQSRLVSEPYYQRFRLASATLTYNSDWVRLTSISSYQTIRQGLGLDDSWQIPLYEPASDYYGFTDGLSKINGPFHSSTNKFTQEVRLSSGSHGPLEWIIGGFYDHEVTDIEENLTYFDAHGLPTGNANAEFEYSSPVSFAEYAPFGTLTWHPTTQFDVSAGLRYSHSAQTVSQRFSTTVPYDTTRSSENVLTYLANARYHFSEQAMAYLRYATGYRPGGPNFDLFVAGTGMTVHQPPFRSDKLKTYELGFKGETEDRRWGVDTAAFYYDWSDLQLYEYTEDFQGYANATGGARIIGAELAVTARPIRGLTLVGALTSLDGRLRQAEPALGAAKDERLPNEARYTVNLSADYAVVSNDYRPTLGADLRIVPDRKAGFNGGASVGAPPYRLPAYTAVDVHAGLMLGPVETQLYVRNLFDKRGQLSAEAYAAAPPFNGPVWVSLIQPRTIGLTVSMDF
jgi:outer membrane receptor protein involved in Fe transport